MIVRILGEGQFDVSEDGVDRLNQLDAAVEAAVDAGDEESFAAALVRLHEGVRTMGVPHADDSLDSSDVILPPADATLAEVGELLADDGLIPG
ncbi:MAG: PspA-associated protein PspAA [Nocardioides sp.]